jgi:hypothetical protein
MRLPIPPMMSATRFSSSAAPDPDSTGIAHDVEQLRATIVAQLRNAGVLLPEDVAASVADAILAEAVRISLLWLETGSGLHREPLEERVHGRP